MAKKTKRPRASNQVSTNFKQNTRARRRNNTAGGGVGNRPGHTQGEFDPEANVKQVAEPMAPAAPAAPAAAPTGDRFADAGLGAAPPSPFPDEAV